MKRDDLSDYLYHWVKADNDVRAFEILSKICEAHSIKASNGFIRGGYNCVCFTETPENQFHKGSEIRYKKFGIGIPKIWAFEQGARPVIYQPESDFELLPDSLRWRHVQFSPPKIDFSWEREWRINCEELKIIPQNAIILVPNAEFGEMLFTRFYSGEDIYIMSVLPEGEWEQMNVEPKGFNYRVV